jgi:ubiquinone/menaquinone biosynthesis C-methylase UbiE
MRIPAPRLVESPLAAVAAASACAELHAAVAVLIERWPEHGLFVAGSLAAHPDADFPLLDRLAGKIRRIAAMEFPGFVDSYRWMCGQIIENELHFRRTGRYPCATFAEAAERVYDNPPFMKRYVEGILLSQLFWSNHAHAFLYFCRSFLPRLIGDSPYLEIGPGHGLFLSEAAQTLGSQRICAWDVSEQSLAQTRDCLGRLSVSRPVELVRCSILEPPPERTFGGAVISEVLEHLENPAVALAHLFQALRPGGTLFVNMPVNSPAPDHIYVVRHPDEVQKLVEAAGFEILDQSNIPMTGRTLEQALRKELTISALIIARRPER